MAEREHMDNTIEAAERWSFEPGHTQVRFRARHMMVTYVDGLLKDIRGSLHWNRNKPGQASCEAVIDATQIWTGEAKRDAHLRSEDFFDTERHPEITFRSSEVKVGSETELEVAGMLSMRGAELPVVLNTTCIGEWSTAYWESKGDEWRDFGPVRRVGFTADLRLNRQRWGVSWQDRVEHGGVVVSDDIDVRIDVEALLDADVARAEEAVRRWKAGL